MVGTYYTSLSPTPDELYIFAHSSTDPLDPLNIDGALYVSELRAVVDPAKLHLRLCTRTHQPLEPPRIFLIDRYSKEVDDGL